MNKKGSTNKGDILFSARHNFIKMLINEAREIMGLSFSELDDKLEEIVMNSSKESQIVGNGSRKRTIKIKNINTRRYYHGKKPTAPPREYLQLYECYFAKLLGREPNILVIEINYSEFKIKPDTLIPKYKYYIDDLKVKLDRLERPTVDEVTGTTKWVKLEKTDLKISYLGGCLTYDDIKIKIGTFCIYDNLNESGYEKWPDFLKKYDWQWGYLWKKKLPWLDRNNFAYDPEITLEQFISCYSQSHKTKALWAENSRKHPATRIYLTDSINYYLNGDDRNGDISYFTYLFWGAFISQADDFLIPTLTYDKWLKILISNKAYFGEHQESTASDKISFGKYRDLICMSFLLGCQGLHDDEIHEFLLNKFEEIKKLSVNYQSEHTST